MKKFSSLVLSNSPRSSLSNASFLGRRFFPVPPTLALMRATKPCFFPPFPFFFLLAAFFAAFAAFFSSFRVFHSASSSADISSLPRMRRNRFLTTTRLSRLSPNRKLPSASVVRTTSSTDADGSMEAFASVSSSSSPSAAAAAAACRSPSSSSARSASPRRSPVPSRRSFSFGSAAWRCVSSPFASDGGGEISPGASDPEIPAVATRRRGDVLGARRPVNPGRVEGRRRPFFLFSLVVVRWSPETTMHPRASALRVAPVRIAPLGIHRGDPTCVGGAIVTAATGMFGRCAPNVCPRGDDDDEAEREPKDSKDLPVIMYCMYI